MTPDPRPPPTSIWTTAGPRAAAIASGVPAVSFGSTGVIAVEESSRFQITKPTTATSASATKAATILRPRCRRCAGGGGGGTSSVGAWGGTPSVSGGGKAGGAVGAATSPTGGDAGRSRQVRRGTVGVV